MSCPHCSVHSFHPFGIQEDTTLVYTAPALTVEKETAQTLGNHKKYLDTMNGPWVWIIDFASMEAKHYTSLGLTQSLIRLLNAEHSDKLKGIYLINPNFWLRSVIPVTKPLLNPTLQKKIHLCETSILELGSVVEHRWLRCLDQIRIKNV
jgi:hypothetical protein